MKPSIYSTVNKNSSGIQLASFCSTVSLILLITSSAYSETNYSNNDNAPVRTNFMEEQLLDVSAHKLEYGESDLALIGMLVQLADTQSLSGEYVDSIDSLTEALQVSRINNGLYHYPQIEILDELIANKIFNEGLGGC